MTEKEIANKVIGIAIVVDKVLDLNRGICLFSITG